MPIHCDLVILLLIVLTGQGHTATIYGGRVVEAHSRPYMVHLERLMPDGSTMFCGGFLVSVDFVMTAAHCDAKTYTVLLGLHDFFDRENVQHLHVEKVFPHPDYETDHNSDIMLLKLSSSATINTNVTTINLADEADPSPESCLTCGWGFFNCKKKFSHLLREAKVTVNTMPCRKNHYYCADGLQGPGPGDSGGPLVCENGKAYGVVSGAYEDPSGTWRESYFAKIPDYKAWIDTTMTNN